jgi:hypothetical protein
MGWWRRELGKGREGMGMYEVEQSLSGDTVTHGSGPPDLTAVGLQVHAGGGGQGAMRAGKGDPHRGVERTAHVLLHHYVRQHPRPVLQPHRALPHRQGSV